MDKEEKHTSRCSNCKRNYDSFRFRCKYCGKYFCSNCRLPEDHHCKGLGNEKKSYWNDEEDNHKSENDFSYNKYENDEPENNVIQKGKNKFFIYSIITLVIVLLILGLIALNIANKKRIDALPKCYDNTTYGSCSFNKPLYCDNGTLIKKAYPCGCPNDYKIDGDNCVKIQRCSDNTIYDECSYSKPLFCDKGILKNQSSKCGCPYGLVEDNNNCVSQFQTGEKKVTLTYILNGQAHNFDFKVYQGLDNYLSGLPRSITYMEGQSPPTQKDFLDRDINQNDQDEFLNSLVNKIKMGKKCSKCGRIMSRWQYVNCGDYSKELFKYVNGKIVFNVTQWLDNCDCGNREITPMTDDELERINNFYKKQKDKITETLK